MGCQSQCIQRQAPYPRSSKVNDVRLQRVKLLIKRHQWYPLEMLSSFVSYVGALDTCNHMGISCESFVGCTNCLCRLSLSFNDRTGLWPTSSTALRHQGHKKRQMQWIPENVKVTPFNLLCKDVTKYKTKEAGCCLCWDRICLYSPGVLTPEVYNLQHRFIIGNFKCPGPRQSDTNWTATLQMIQQRRQRPPLLILSKNCK